MSDFLMPSLGTDMKSGTLVEWQVQPGDRVSRGQVIAVVETAKGAIEVEVFEDGVIEELYARVGTEQPVGTPLARIGNGMNHDLSNRTPPPMEAPAPSPPGTPEPKRLTGMPRASPAARRRAREMGIDWAHLQGSGPVGTIVLADIERLLSATASPPSAPSKHFDYTEMRRVIAAAMSRSKREIPHYYLRQSVDLHRAEHWLTTYNREQPPAGRILMVALLMKATALALRRYPDLNGHYDKDQGFSPADSINLGMAVHLRGGGLVAPALLDTDHWSLPELMERLQDLVQRARSGGLRGSEISGATATVTALGERGVDTVYGVIHPPQVAMIGFGRVTQRPWVIDDAIAIHPVSDLTLAADHRVCDGHLGALFLSEIEKWLKQPEQL